MHDIEELKRELVSILKDIDKDRLDLCDLGQYAEVLKTVSEIKGKDYMEIVAEMVASPMPGWGSSPKALGGMTIGDMKEHKVKDHNKDEEDDD